MTPAHMWLQSHHASADQHFLLVNKTKHGITCWRTVHEVKLSQSRNRRKKKITYFPFERSFKDDDSMLSIIKLLKLGPSMEIKGTEFIKRWSFLSSFSCPKPVWISLFCWTQKIDFYRKEKINTVSEWLPSTVCSAILIKISSSVFDRREKLRFETT